MHHRYRWIKYSERENLEMVYVLWLNLKILHFFYHQTKNNFINIKRRYSLNMKSHQCCNLFQTEARGTSLKTVAILWWSRIFQYRYAKKRPTGNSRQISNNLQTNVWCQSGSLQYFLEYVIRLIKKVPANSVTFNSPLPLFVLCPSQSNVTLFTSIPQCSPLQPSSSLSSLSTT